ncbi:hypothetical protein CYFUS_009367 [Cystobacter fuscus]|uniref:PRC-barrel domain-containing protein n=1 Tax=Cystobacter fuscus TaxID=43 RepID=A0A250JL74_9BACT|nr:hypothetical protein [Cystobacter fuscus]ATB43886.1 hypothetical protein CYFUS_009367 [Cystobacter fuscus]
MNADWLNSPFERRSIQHAMKVWDEDGTLLGRVKAIGQTVLFVHRRPSKALWAVPLSHVQGVSGRGVIVSGRGHAALEPAGDRWRTEIVTAIHPLAESSQAPA